EVLFCSDFTGNGGADLKKPPRQRRRYATHWHAATQNDSALSPAIRGGYGQLLDHLSIIILIFQSLEFQSKEVRGAIKAPAHSVGVRSGVFPIGVIFDRGAAGKC